MSITLEQGITVERDVVYAVHDGVDLEGDWYLPAGSGPFPAMLLLHGGGMQSGSKDAFEEWGRHLAVEGNAAFSVDYRLATSSWPAYPHNIFDVKAAVQFMRGTADRWRIRPDAIAAMGGSAGGYLAAMLVLTCDVEGFRSPYRDDEFADLDPGVRIAIPMSGAYDMIQQWEHDQLHRPLDHIKEKYLGGTPMSIRETYYQASPIYHASTANAAGTKWLVAWGTEDDVIASDPQSVVFVEHLKRAGALVRTVPLLGAPHFWWSDSAVDEPGSYNAVLAPRIRGFLRRWVKW